MIAFLPEVRAVLDAEHCYRYNVFRDLCAYIDASISPLSTSVRPTKRLNQSIYRLEADSCGSKEPCIVRRCTLAPPGEYNGMICAAVAILPVATITAATCSIV